MNREQRQEIARQTLQALKQGSYKTATGTQVDIGSWQRTAEAESRLYRPEDAAALLAPKGSGTSAAKPAEVRVYNATTLAAASDLVSQYQRVACLNFASARNPGGGFLGGSQAQEESLARSTGLYPCIAQFSEMYQHNAHLNGLYSDYLIFSPGVPVLLTDEGEWLAEPYRIDIITAPAVNAGALRRNNPELLDQLVPTMQRRIRQVLAVAARNRCEALVLGAWGCGVFGNDPAQIAELFAEALAEPAVRNQFRRIDFAVFDPKLPYSTLHAFEQAFA
ncbi:TIGR02452 family protein [Hymenobacter lutimineralis]|uniref:TIGR02452 family protein n=1 Tax=Hymenobacter lutimineralis TaxID=2606448 RepID=A0A5D6VE81_9BACT|nr:TIGR02452 family protein [Hymenobacter lutimineralis]TYZ14391.1 TIGR02452 family protein [Hymenobacter lutimineralis]